MSKAIDLFVLRSLISMLSAIVNQLILRSDGVSYLSIYIMISLNQIIPYELHTIKKRGFCVSYRQYQLLKSFSGKFHVYIDSEFKNGSLTYADFRLRGNLQKKY